MLQEISISIPLTEYCTAQSLQLSHAQVRKETFE